MESSRNDNMVGCAVGAIITGGAKWSQVATWQGLPSNSVIAITENAVIPVSALGVRNENC